MVELKRTGRIIISVVAALVLSFCFMCAASYATGHNSLTGYSAGVASITVSGGTVAEDVTPVISGDQYTYNIDLTENWSSLQSDTVTVTFAKDTTNYPNCEISTNRPTGLFNSTKRKNVRKGATLVYTATIDQTNLNGSTTAYVYYDLENHVTSYKTYVFNFTCNGAQNPRILPNGAFISVGDPNYALTEPECDMQITASTSPHTITYNGTRTGYYPSTFSLYIDSNSTLTVPSAYANVISLDYPVTSGGYTGYTINHTAYAELTLSHGGTNETIKIPAPAEESAANSGAAPKAVRSYLPIGQFANGSGWGSSGGSGTTATKFVGKTAPESMGVSLGAFGGYIEYEFEDEIENYAGNPYGVDFVVYGNAFAGNPEAGAVQVSEDGLTWYELAGSKYYETDDITVTGSTYTGTLRNATADYQLGTNITAKIKAGTTDKVTVPFSNTNYWPLSDEGYPMGTHVNTNANIQVSHSNTALAMTGITAIEDSNANAEYGYGYADVTPNGNFSSYGNPVNPYTPFTNGKVGGDGFDLDWATDISTGMPVSLANKHIKFVRVYSSVLFDAGQFGETSTEVTGVFVTPRVEGRTSVGRTSDDITITVGGVDLDDSSAVSYSEYGNVQYYDAHLLNAAANSQIEVTPSSLINNPNIYINNEPDDSFTYNGTQYVRVVVQEGAKEPCIKMIRLR